MVLGLEPAIIAFISSSLIVVAKGLTADEMPVSRTIPFAIHEAARAAGERSQMAMCIAGTSLRENESG